MLPYIYILKWFVLNRLAFTPLPNIKPNSYLDFFIEPQQRVWLNNWKLAKLLLRQVGPYDIQMTDVDAVSVVRPRDLVMKWQVGAYRAPPPQKKKQKGCWGGCSKQYHWKNHPSSPLSGLEMQFWSFLFFWYSLMSIIKNRNIAIPDNTPSVWILVI